MHRFRKPLVALLLAVPLVLTGCADDNDIEPPSIEPSPGELDPELPNPEIVEPEDVPGVEVSPTG